MKLRDYYELPVSPEYRDQSIYSPENLVQKEEVSDLFMDGVFVNYSEYTLMRKKDGQKNARNLNESYKTNWNEIDKIIKSQTGKNFFQWFYLQYFEEELGVHEVHENLCKRIAPISLQYSVFFKFIKERAFVEIRTRSSGQKTGIAQRRLRNRERAVLTPEQIAKKTENIKNALQKLSSKERSQIAQNGWKTRRAKTNKDVQNVLNLKD